MAAEFRDAAGQVLAVGDRVALIVVGYRHMMLGTILRFTPKGMKVSRPTKYDPKGETFREPGMVVKVPHRLTPRSTPPPGTYFDAA